MYLRLPGAAEYPELLIFLWKVTGKFVFCNFDGKTPIFAFFELS